MMEKLTRLEIKWGILFTLAGLFWHYYEKMMGWHGDQIEKHATYTMLFMFPAITIYVVALIDKRKNSYNNIMTWKQGFICGMYITLVVAILAPLSQTIAHQFISPDYFTNMIEYSANKLGKDRGELEAYFNFRSYVMQSVVGALVLGMFTSAVVAIFVRRNPEIQ